MKSSFAVVTLPAIVWLCFASTLTAYSSEDNQIKSVHVGGDKLQIIEENSDPSAQKNAAFEASGSYEKNISGWSFLSISTPLPVSIDDQILKYRAAGITEGYLTCMELKESYPNFYADNFGHDLPSEDLLNFIIENYLWMRSESAKHYRTSSYWLATSSSLEQLRGVAEGYLRSPCKHRGDGEKVLIDQLQVFKEDDKDGSSSSSSSSIATQLRAQMKHVNDVDQLGLLHLLLMNAWGDLYTIMTKLSLNSSDATISGNTTALEAFIARRKRISHPHSQVERDLRCSSLFKLLPNNEDILFGHATWASFIALGPRTFKYYNLPSASVSVDHQYTSASLAVLETTNDLFLPSLFALITPESCLCWMRALTANALATDGRSWTELFGYLHSGTYPNQWQVLDMNKFQPGIEPGADLFWVLEEIPGELVADGYWASYNVPYFESISVHSGTAMACRLQRSLANNTDNCWADAPRANIFRERQGDLTSVEGLGDLLYYNDWKNDPLSQADPCKAIACRRDLEPAEKDRYPSGLIDAKVSSVRKFRESSLHSKGREGPAAAATAFVRARLGPTNDLQPTFCWSGLETHYVHLGQPDCFDYAWTEFPV
eukprot:gene28533-37491_t